MRLIKTLSSFALLCVLTACGQGAEPIRVGGADSLDERLTLAGSSTVAPFATTAAEFFGATSVFSTPVVETTGTGGGMKLFCSGVSETTPSIATASRRIKPSEVDLCKNNGVNDIIELKIGYDGIVLIDSVDGPSFDLTRNQMFLALAKDTPTETGGLRANPYERWSEIDPALPDIRIEVFGPPPTSGTRDAFAELVLEAGARSFDTLNQMAALDPNTFTIVAHTIRTDGAWIDAGENDTQIIQGLVRNPEALGVVGFSYLDQSGDRVKAAPVDGVEPSFDNIASGRYGVSRSLYFYVKADHLDMMVSLEPFLQSVLSDAAMGTDGYLVLKGLIPLPAAERLAMLERLADRETLGN